MANNTLNTPMSFHRLMKTPLDDSSVFNSVPELINYIKLDLFYYYIIHLRISSIILKKYLNLILILSNLAYLLFILNFL